MVRQVLTSRITWDNVIPLPARIRCHPDRVPPAIPHLTRDGEIQDGGSDASLMSMGRLTPHDLDLIRREGRSGFEGVPPNMSVNSSTPLSHEPVQSPARCLRGRLHLIMPADRYRRKLRQVADDHLGGIHQAGRQLPAVTTTTPIWPLSYGRRWGEAGGSLPASCDSDVSMVDARTPPRWSGPGAAGPRSHRSARPPVQPTPLVSSSCPPRRSAAPCTAVSSSRSMNSRVEGRVPGCRYRSMRPVGPHAGRSAGPADTARLTSVGVDERRLNPAQQGHRLARNRSRDSPMKKCRSS